VNQEDMYSSGAYLERDSSCRERDSPCKARKISKSLKPKNRWPTTVHKVSGDAGTVLNCLAAEYGHSVSFTGYVVSPKAFALWSRKGQAPSALLPEQPSAGPADVPGRAQFHRCLRACRRMLRLSAPAQTQGQAQALPHSAEFFGAIGVSPPNADGHATRCWLWRKMSVGDPAAALMTTAALL